MKHLYLIGGPMGVGKTTVCQQLKQTLPYSVFLDGDWCWDASPFQVTPETLAMVLDNICHLLNNFLACTAYQNVVFCWVLHQQDIWDTILGRLHLEGCAVHCVALSSPAALPGCPSMPPCPPGTSTPPARRRPKSRPRSRSLDKRLERRTDKKRGPSTRKALVALPF